MSDVPKFATSFVGRARERGDLSRKQAALGGVANGAGAVR